MHRTKICAGCVCVPSLLSGASLSRVTGTNYKGWRVEQLSSCQMGIMKSPSYFELIQHDSSTKLMCIVHQPHSVVFTFNVHFLVEMEYNIHCQWLSKYELQNAMWGLWHWGTSWQCLHLTLQQPGNSRCYRVGTWQQRRASAAVRGH